MLSCFITIRLVPWLPGNIFVIEHTLQIYIHLHLEACLHFVLLKKHNLRAKEPLCVCRCSSAIKIRPINTHHKHKCTYFLFAWSPSNSCAFTYTSLCVFKSVKILRWHRTLSSCLSLSFSYIYTAIAEWLDFKVLSQLPSYNIQPVRHFTVTYNFPCAPRPHKDRPICRWKRPKLDSLIEKCHTEKSQPERVVYLRFSLVLLKIITS